MIFRVFHWYTSLTTLRCHILVDKPGKPGVPQISSVSPTSVTLNWTRPDSDGGCPVDGYVVEYRAEGAFKWLSATPEPAPNTSFTVKSLVEDTVYEFRVAAHNKAGVGAFSNNSSPVKAEEPIGMYVSL